MEIREMTGNPEPEGGADSMTIEEMLDQLEGLLEQMEKPGQLSGRDLCLL